MENERGARKEGMLMKVKGLHEAWSKVNRLGHKKITVTLTVGELHHLLGCAHSSLVVQRKYVSFSTAIAEVCYHKCIRQLLDKQQGKNYYNARHLADALQEKERVLREEKVRDRSS